MAIRGADPDALCADVRGDHPVRQPLDGKTALVVHREPGVIINSDMIRNVPTTAGIPVLTVLVIGDTARAQKLSLDGYGRDTTPELSRLDIIKFRDVDNCTTTAASMPCMLSKFDRSSVSHDIDMANENLLDVLHRAAQHDQHRSHAKLFHPVLGLLDIQTKERDAAPDIFAPCRAAATTGATLEQKPT